MSMTVDAVIRRGRAHAPVIYICIYICVHICVCTCICVYLWVYTFIVAEALPPTLGLGNLSHAFSGTRSSK
ncbi:hypothetical protein MAPG_09820 [Magnaporthiopsis poae ATCC 64411]|uniref:Uncharacterized protein n=1 Tax=Magnaporthiopsis poae (strain ATCC 64411 / 73-15) TaxID=644358 RepID=A0A0C4EAY3_MAGP6|nr:hypothetical protein MAPG_09820 [Magnaporthiopsis poae ATCC 64411]